MAAKVPKGSRSRRPRLSLGRPRQIDAEVVERQVGDRDAASKVFQIDDRAPATCWSCLRRYSRSFIGLPDCCSIRFSSPVAEMSSSTMRPLTRCSRLMYSSSSMLGQKLTSWMRALVRADAVDAAKALDDAHRIPVDVVVDERSRSPGGSALRKCNRWRSSRSISPSSASSSGRSLARGANAVRTLDEIRAQSGESGLVTAGARHQSARAGRDSTAPTAPARGRDTPPYRQRR